MPRSTLVAALESRMDLLSTDKLERTVVSVEVSALVRSDGPFAN